MINYKMISIIYNSIIYYFRMILINLMYIFSYTQIYINKNFYKKKTEMLDNSSELIKNGKIIMKINLDYSNLHILNTYENYDFIIIQKIFLNRVFNIIKYPDEKIDNIESKIDKESVVPSNKHFLNIEVKIDNLMEPYEISLKTPNNYYVKNVKLLTNSHLKYLLYTYNNFILEQDISYEIEIMDQNYETILLNEKNYVIYKDNKWNIC